ncbi:MAG: hypothetical protein ACI4DK_11245 [Lachnospiraceae bacterium]
MKTVESDCVDCGLPCLYEACPHYRVTRYLCDECEEEQPLYYFDGRELCGCCILESLEKVEESWS